MVAHNFGAAYLGLGEHRRAAEWYRTAAELSAEIGDAAPRAEALNRLADVYDADGRLTEAADACERALAIYDELGHPDAAKARTKLAGLRRETAHREP